MESIHRLNGAPPGNSSLQQAGAAVESGSQAAARDNFAPAGPADPDLEKQKILKDMIFNQDRDPIHTIWSYDTGSPVVETPMTSPDGKTLYVACADSRIHAIDTATGKEKWATSAEAGAMWDANVTLGPDGRNIFVTGQNGVLQCIDASKGEKKWEFDSGKNRGNFSRTVLRCGDRNECSSDGSTVFASLERRQVSAFDANTGEKKWNLETSIDTYGKPVLSRDETTLFIAIGGSGIMAIDASTGKSKGEFFGGDPAICSAAIDSSGEKLFISGISSFMACDLRRSEEAAWTFKRKSGIFAIPPVLNEKDGIVYAFHYDLKEGSHIFGLHTGTGEERWSYHAPAEINVSPALSQDGSTLFIGMKDGEFAAVDTATGRKKWGFKTTTTASPAVSPDGRVIYIGSRDGKLYALAEDALEECLARKKNKGAVGDEAVPEVIMEDGFIIIDGVKMRVNLGKQ